MLLSCTNSAVKYNCRKWRVIFYRKVFESLCWLVVYLTISCHPVVCKTVNHELQHCPIQAAILHWNCILSSQIPEEFRSWMFCHFLWFDAICLWQSLLPLRFLNPLAKKSPRIITEGKLQIVCQPYGSI